MNELLYVWYDISQKGTKYLIEMIYLIYIRGEDFVNNLKKYVYPIIAQKHNESINNIKCNVIRATENMYYNCDEQRFKEYFHLFESKKPNVKMVINAIMNKLQ